jgi:ABC transport system ATP-binding/permease protein
MILIDAQSLAASRPNRPLFADVSFTLTDADRVGLVGLNGCGKSTLLRILAGRQEPDAGVVRTGRGVRIGVLDQHPQLPTGTVRDAVGAGWEGEAMLDRLGMSGLVGARTDALSGGQSKRVALAALLIGDYDALILDEPTNHLDLDAIQFLEERLAAFRGGVLLVTHDRHVLDRVTNRVLEMDRGKVYLHVPKGEHGGSGYAAYLAGREEREAQAEAAEQVRRSLASRELAWLRRGAPARSTKPKARVAAATKLVGTRPAAPARRGELALDAVGSGGRRLGSKGVELHDVSFSWPDVAPRDVVVIDSCELAFEPGDRVGIVGSNGAGKSTLLDLVAGRLQPTSGRVERGRTVKVGYYDQLGRELDLTARVRDVVAGDKGEPSLADLSLMRRFWFDGDAQFAPLGTLSGGERRRLQLLLTLLAEPNVLLLDEPTNDLDLDTLRALEDFLDDWPGIVVTVSHDRAFLDRVTDELLALDGRGSMRWIRGGVQAWLAERAAPTPTATSAPSRVERGVASPPSRPTGGRSPSTIRRLLAQAERQMTERAAARDVLVEQLTGEHDPARLAELGTKLAEEQAELDAAESAWMELADEAEAQGLQL